LHRSIQQVIRLESEAEFMLLESLKKNMAWRAIPIAGLAGGAVFLLAIFILMPLLLKVNGVLFLRYAASLLMGETAVMDGGAGAIILGIVVHFALSMVFALVIGVVVHRWGIRVGIIGGALLGLAIYGIDLFTFTRIFTWFFAISGPVLLISHVLFGAVAGC
jgi:hypothetical protein